MRDTLFVLSFVLLAACATPPDYEATKIESPPTEELLTQSAFLGEWAIEGCKNAKQAEKIVFIPNEKGLTLKRWQWKKDLIPLFEVSIEEDRQNMITYQSKDMHNLNPVLNHSNWMWMDGRVVSSIQWQLDEEDQRGPWTGVALGQFYIKKDNPNKLYWVRWGTTHTSDKGLSQWDSSCTYSKVKNSRVTQALNTSVIDDEEIVSQAQFEKEELAKQKIYNDTLDMAKNKADPERRRIEDLQFLRKSQRRSSNQLSDSLKE